MDARIFIPLLGVRGTVSFLLDTGADQTVLMPVDARKLGVKYRGLVDKVTSTGVGGNSIDFITPAILSVSDGVLHSYIIDLTIMRKRRVLMDAPSLLGRDVMDRWNMTFDRSQNIMTAEIRNSDHQSLIP